MPNPVIPSSTTPSHGLFPTVRMRRMRRDKFSRDLMRENHLLPSDLILPVFVLDQDSGTEPILSMPGVDRLGRDELRRVAERCLRAGIPALAIFPTGPFPKCACSHEAPDWRKIAPPMLQSTKPGKFVPEVVP